MTREIQNKMDRLSEIAQLRSDRSLGDLAEAAQECARLSARIKELERLRHKTLQDASGPLEIPLAVTYAEHLAQRRREVLQALARAEVRRRAATDIARKDEGRRQALEQIRRHVS